MCNGDLPAPGVCLRIGAALAALAALPYLRSLALPFIADDYVQIWLARLYGPAGSWSQLAADPLYRCRATSLLMTYWTERLFGLDPLAFALSSLALHILNTWLVFALGVWRAIGWRAAALAAGFFAAYEGHQEAVIWYAALPELLVFTFSLAALLCWVNWIQSGGVSWAWYAASIAAFGLALISKESAVAVTALLLLPVWTERMPWRRWLPPWLVFVALSAAYAALVFAGRSQHLHFRDGTFSLSAPVLLVWSNSYARLFWFWGAASLAILARRRPAQRRGLLVVAGLWIAITLLPYSFLTYMPRVPSRHTYFASAGLALVPAAAALALWEHRQRQRWACCTLALALLAHNAGYVWTRKHRQFAERAAPTEALIEFARAARAPVYLHCFPYYFDIADWAVRLRLGKRVLPASAYTGAGVLFCYPPHRHGVAAARVAAHSGGGE